MNLRNSLMRLMLVASFLLILLGGCSPKEGGMVLENAEIGLNILETPNSNVVSKNPFLRFNWLKTAKESEPRWEIGPLAPLYRFPRPTSGSLLRASVSTTENFSNSLHGSGIDVISMKRTSGSRPTMMMGRIHKRMRHPSNVNHTTPQADFFKRHVPTGSSKRRVPRHAELKFTLETQHKRVKKDSVIYPGPIFMSSQQQQFPNYGLPPFQQQPQYSPNPDFMQARGFQLTMQTGGAEQNNNNPNFGALALPPPSGPHPPPGGSQFGPQPSFGPAVFSSYYQNPDEIIKTDDGPFHFHIPIVSDVPQPFPDMAEMMKIALQYKNPLDTEALLPEEKRRPIVPLFLQPYVLPNKRFSRNLEKPDSESRAKIEIEATVSSSVNNNALTDDDFDEASQENERLEFLSKLEDQLAMLHKRTKPVPESEKPQSAETETKSDDTTPKPEKNDAKILARKKRGFMKWIKGLFHKKEAEPEPTPPEHEHPSPSYDHKPPKKVPTTTTQRSRPPPDESSEMISVRKQVKPAFRREPPVHITAPTRTSKVSNSKHDDPTPVGVSDIEVPSEQPKLPTKPEPLSKADRVVEKGSGVDTHVDKLLPEYMRTSAYLERTIGTRQNSKNHEAKLEHRTDTDYADAEEVEDGDEDKPKKRTKRSTNDGSGFNFAPRTNGPVTTSVMSKQEMRLLHELFLNVVSRKCLVNRDQLIYVGMSIQDIIQMSDLPDIPFSVSHDPAAAHLAQQLLTCRSFSNQSPFDPFRYYNFRTPLVNPTQFQTGPVSNQLLGEVDEGDPVLRTKRGKRSVHQFGSYIQVRPPMQLAYLLHVEFLITQIVKEHCSQGLDLSTLKTVGDKILRTIEKVCRERQCFSTLQQPAVNLDNDLYFCSRRSFQQNNPY